MVLGDIRSSLFQTVLPRVFPASDSKVKTKLSFFHSHRLLATQCRDDKKDEKIISTCPPAKIKIKIRHLFCLAVCERPKLINKPCNNMRVSVRAKKKLFFIKIHAVVMSYFMLFFVPFFVLFFSLFFKFFILMLVALATRIGCYLKF